VIKAAWVNNNSVFICGSLRVPALLAIDSGLPHGRTCFSSASFFRFDGILLRYGDYITNDNAFETSSGCVVN
jgi:hypothetical protein